MNGWIKLHRSLLTKLETASDPEFRYYVASLLISVWDRRNKVAGTFDARTHAIKRDMLPNWSTGKINMTKNALLRRGLYQKTDDPRRLQIVEIQRVESLPTKNENIIQKVDNKVQGRELNFQEREAKLKHIRAMLFKKPKEDEVI